MKYRSKNGRRLPLLLGCFFAVILAITWLTGCSSQQLNRPEQLAQPQENSGQADAEQGETGPEEPLNRELEVAGAGDGRPGQLSAEEMARLQVNELGQVMVLMYHVIGEQEGEWARTRENFRQDLRRLYELGYRTVTMTDFLTGRMDVPAGTTPVILTFDDGTVGQFRFLEEDGQLVVDPHCAVGILLDFATEFPDFGQAATFYVNFPNPFGQPKYWQEKLNFLVAHGMEVGNHSYSHANLSKLSDEEVQRELATQVEMVQQAVPGYQVNSLALPFGISAKNRALEIKGNYQGLEYEHLAVLRVGANPSYPPEHVKFDPARVPRVRADQQELDKWLAYFQANPHLRYISDGDPETLAIPQTEEVNINYSRVEGRKLIVYGIQENSKQQLAH